MKLTLKLTLVVGLAFIAYNAAVSELANLIKKQARLQMLEKEFKYYREAASLNDLLFREETPVHMQVVVDLLKNIDKQLPKYYPQGPYTRNDFIALAWVESEFRQYEHGTHGERGIFQIMPDEFKDFDVRKNYYDVDVNTEMAFRVLTGKYKQHKDYKIAIIAYNGLVYHHGKLSEKYWKAFQKRKLALDMVLVSQ